jgi:cytolysin-activating lysine-acyltransferase
MINEMQVQLSCQIGSLMQVLLNTERRTFKLISIALQTIPALRVNQMCVIRNERGEPTGYVLWAFLSDEVASQMIANPDRLLHYSEWNEGLNLWIIDFVAQPGFARKLVSALRNGPLREFDRFHGIRIRGDGAIRRIVDRKVFRRQPSQVDMPRSMVELPSPAPRPDFLSASMRSSL